MEVQSDLFYLQVHYNTVIDCDSEHVVVMADDDILRLDVYIVFLRLLHDHVPQFFVRLGGLELGDSGYVILELIAVELWQPKHEARNDCADDHH